MTTEVDADRGFGLARGAGDARWWFGGLAVIKLRGADTGGGLSLLEMLYPPGYEVPLHLHRREHEMFYVLEGRMEVHVGADVFDGSPGATISVPRGTPHRFTVTSDEPAHYLIAYAPAGFEEFVAEVSEAAPSLTLPPPAEPPPPDVVEQTNRLMADKYGTELVDS